MQGLQNIIRDRVVVRGYATPQTFVESYKEWVEYSEERGDTMMERHEMSQHIRKIWPETPPFFKKFMEGYNSDMHKRGAEVDPTEVQRYQDTWLCGCGWCLNSGYSAESMRYKEVEEERAKRWQGPDEYFEDEREAA
ncbi:hypothetical protein DUNSADRAFT_5627 [Dunaliella salina]|uniref:Uncharacterized protein n=1 Tax=Dunaliella salina TaxID=3046 RepID=A0ABQ7FU58_DUNSA|nr:hypothetical protein DUNSADRAFT_5627 [Dunaliella salina]|eukprot:KAF5825965.1 hypothetical protein DUNSADRAFT_5627 [Dunaliella salina]